MYATQIPHGDEEYYCRDCKIRLYQNDVRNDWKCPVCNQLVEIRVKTKKLDNSCFRVKVKDLKIGDMVLLKYDDEFRMILNLKKDRETIRVAIEKYTVLPLEQNNLILKLNGGWYH